MQTLLLDTTWYQNEGWSISKTLITSILGAYVAYRFAIWQKRKDNVIQIDKDKNALILKSLQDCWKLLAYMSPNENPKSILTFEREKGTKNDLYFFNKQNTEAFMNDLSAYFYGSGLGLFLPKEIKPLLFKYRSQMFGLLLGERNNSESKIQLTNKEFYTDCQKIYLELNAALRNACDMQTPTLPE